MKIPKEPLYAAGLLAIGVGVAYGCMALLEAAALAEFKRKQSAPGGLAPGRQQLTPVSPGLLPGGWVPPAYVPYVVPGPVIPAQPVPVGPPPPPHLLGGDPITVSPGRMYWAAVTVGWPLSMKADEQSIKKYTEDLGFTNVIVTKNVPSYWPDSHPPKADYFLTGTYSGAPKAIARPKIQVDIQQAWEA